MSETFYRVHWDECPPLAVENAWSALWGSDHAGNGKVTCTGCGGTGGGWHDERCTGCHGDGFTRDGDMCGDCVGAGFAAETGCGDCDGTGLADCARGYSCCTTPEALADYFAVHGAPLPDSTVVIFEGYQCGTGFDGEPLAIPGNVTQTMSWHEFTGQYAA
jgi:hypothetical protein